MASSSSEAQDVLRWAIRPTYYRCICMAIEIAGNPPAFFIIIDFVVAQNHI